MAETHTLEDQPDPPVRPLPAPPPPAPPKRPAAVAAPEPQEPKREHPARHAFRPPTQAEIHPDPKPQCLTKGQLALLRQAAEWTVSRLVDVQSEGLPGETAGHCWQLRQEVRTLLEHLARVERGDSRLIALVEE